MKRRTLQERFLEKVRKTENCWEWMGAKQSAGYGEINEGGRWGKVLCAHRVAYELFVSPIPEGKWVLHHCDNPGCVNPNHLFIGTHTDNVADCTAKGRRPRGEQVASAKLTWAQVQEIRGQYQPRSPMFGGAALSRRYGVGTTTIWWIVHNHDWKPIE